MFEAVPRDRNNPEQQEEAWYIKRVVEAVDNNNVGEIVRELKHAWASGYAITGSPVQIREKGPDNVDKKVHAKTLYDILWSYFDNLIEEHQLTPEERKKLYRIFRENDLSMSEIFIQSRDDPDADQYENEKSQLFEDSRLNPPE